MATTAVDHDGGEMPFGTGEFSTDLNASFRERPESALLRLLGFRSCSPIWGMIALSALSPVPGRAAQTGADLISSGSAKVRLAQAPQEDVAARDRWLDRAFEAMAKGDYAEVEKDILAAQRFATLRDGDLKTLWGAQTCLGKLDAALATARLNYAMYPKDSTALYLAEALGKVGKFPEARAVLREMFKKFSITEESEYVQSPLKQVALKEYELTIDLNWKKLDPDGQRFFQERGYYECYLPQDTEYQKAVASVVVCKRYETHLDAGGNKFFRIWPDGENSPVQVCINFVQIPMRFDLQKEFPEGYPDNFVVPEDLKYFTQKTRIMDPTTDTVGAIAARLKGPTPQKTLENLLAWWGSSGEMTWGWEGRNLPENANLPLSEKTLREKGAKCGGISVAMTAVAIRLGFVARPVLVLTGIEPTSNNAGFHGCIEVWAPGSKSWMPLESGIPLGMTVPCYLRLANEDPDDEKYRRPMDSGGRIFYSMHAPGEGPDSTSNLKLRFIRYSLDEPPAKYKLCNGSEIQL